MGLDAKYYTTQIFETRIAILRNKIEDLDFTFPDDTLEYLAGQFDSNVRDLEGALNEYLSRGKS